MAFAYSRPGCAPQGREPSPTSGKPSPMPPAFAFANAAKIGFVHLDKPFDRQALSD
jgi:hypothetical protein